MSSDSESVPTAAMESTTLEQSNFTWEAATQRAKSESKSATKDRFMSEQIKRLKIVAEDEGRAFGPDPTDRAALRVRFNDATNLCNKRIDEVLRSILRARIVQLCFLVDITGSMQSHIDNVRESIYDIVKKLTEKPPQGAGKLPDAQSLSIAFVGYRDIDDRTPFEVLPFTTDVAKFTEFCGKLRASSNQPRLDYPEDVFGGLDTALNLPWSGACGTNVMFHICDDPCHGKEFHAGLGDNYPNGDPKGRTCKGLFDRLLSKGIQYHFGKLTTDIMIRKFAEAYGDKIESFDVKDLAGLRESVITAVSDSISSSVSESKRTVGVAREVRAVTLVAAKPDWTTLPDQKGTFYSYEFPVRIEDIKNDVPLVRKKGKSAIVKIAPNPFGKGADRIAFYGKDVTTYVDRKVGGGGKKKPTTSTSSTSEETKVEVKTKNEEIVLKESLYVGKGMNSAKRYELSSQMQTIASYLAQEFCKDLKLHGISKEIKFLKPRTIFLNSVPARYMSCEKVFSDKFVRFTNNTHYTILKGKAAALGVSMDYVQLVIAFSHWTYKATQRFLMVVDLEGIVSRIGKDGESGVLLTDPAIHCEDTTRYRPMNHGVGGMRNFFAGHECNEYCKKLGLEGFTI